MNDQTLVAAQLHFPLDAGSQAIAMRGQGHRTDRGVHRKYYDMWSGTEIQKNQEVVLLRT
jgi:hypothetical protein